MSCVFFSWISLKILAFSTHLFSFHDIFCVFLCSWKFLSSLEYWNICWLEYFLEILCMKILFCLCVGLIFIYLCHLDCYICFCNFWSIQLTALIIPHFFLELTRSNLSWLCYFWIYLYLNIFRNISSNGSQQSIRQMDPLENRLLLKSFIQFPKVSGYRWACSPSSCRVFHSIFLRSVLVRGSVVNLLIYLADQLLRGC